VTVSPAELMERAELIKKSAADILRWYVDGIPNDENIWAACDTIQAQASELAGTLRLALAVVEDMRRIVAVGSEPLDEMRSFKHQYRERGDRIMGIANATLAAFDASSAGAEK
jgi:hypothetical protein